MAERRKDLAGCHQKVLLQSCRVSQNVIRVVSLCFWYKKNSVLCTISSRPDSSVFISVLGFVFIGSDAANLTDNREIIFIFLKQKTWWLSPTSCCKIAVYSVPSCGQHHCCLLFSLISRTLVHLYVSNFLFLFIPVSPQIYSYPLFCSHSRLNDWIHTMTKTGPPLYLIACPFLCWSCAPNQLVGKHDFSVSLTVVCLSGSNWSMRLLKPPPVPSILC